MSANVNKYDLTRGRVVDKLLLVAIPVIATQFIMMSYNLVDMFLLGKVGSKAVAASGTAGMYLWLGNGFMLLGRMGAEIGVAQNLGRGNTAQAQAYAQNAILLAITVGIAYMLACLVFAGALIGFFNIREADVARDAVVYLRIVALGFPFISLSAAIAGTFNGSGNSRVPFLINAFGLFLNAALDPLFIFVLDMGVAGAAVATAIAQVAAALLAFWALTCKRDRPFERFSIAILPETPYLKQISKWSVPIAAESLVFSFFTMIISRFTARFGADAIAVYRVGTQIESLTWLICMGFSTALTAFIGQNYGAGFWDRIRSCCRASLVLVSVWGILITLALFFAGRPLFELFLSEERLVLMGITFLKILAICQIAACVEAVATGAFRGLGRTLPPSIVNSVCSTLRVPLAYYLSTTTLGVNGIWWGIAVGATIRGIWIFAWFLIDLKNLAPTWRKTTRQHIT